MVEKGDLGSARDALVREVEALRAEVEALRAELRALRTRSELFESVLDLVCVADFEGRFLELNPAWERVLGYAIAELRLKPYLDFVHPDDVEPTREAARRLTEGKDVTRFENRYRTKGGRYRWLSWTAIAKPEERKVYSIARDVTRQHEMEVELRESEAKYRALFNGMLDGYAFYDVVVDEGGTPIDYEFLDVNPAFEEITGLKAGRVVGERVKSVLPDLESQWIEIFGRVAKTGIPTRFEGYSRVFDKHFEILVFLPLPGQVACTFRDVTSRKRIERERAALQAQVLHKQKLEGLGIMAGGIAHDFNNLLAAIISGVELAADELPPATDGGAALESVLTAARRAAELCRQMLMYSGKADLSKAPVQLKALLEETLALATPSISRKNEVDVRVDETPPAVEADRTQVQQVVLNLLLNATEAIGDREGRIEITTRERRLTSDDIDGLLGNDEMAPDEYVELSIRDTGGGMPPSVVKRIFDPFFSTKFTGRGLGLAATLGIVRAHGGGIRVDTEEGVGTTFRVYLPVSGKRAEAEKSSELAGRPNAAGTLLVCDDEALVRDLTARLARGLGYEVQEAVDGQVAVELIEQSPQSFAALVIDLSMPRMSGIEAVSLLREHNVDVPVILMSGHEESQTVSAAQSLGPIAFLRKPFRRNELQDLLSKLTTGRPRESSAGS